MTLYEKILLATDLFEQNNRLAARAQALATRFEAELSIVHVLEPLPIMEPGYAEILSNEIDLTEQMLAVATSRMDKYAAALDVPAERRYVELGNPKVEIVRVAEQLNADLIVIGTHGRHGLGVLLGSTASSVVHHANCDVLTVRLKSGQS